MVKGLPGGSVTPAGGGARGCEAVRFLSSVISYAQRPAIDASVPQRRVRIGEATVRVKEMLYDSASLFPPRTRRMASRGFVEQVQVTLAQT